jgi:hypothetical protein
MIIRPCVEAGQQIAGPTRHWDDNGGAGCSLDACRAENAFASNPAPYTGRVPAIAEHPESLSCSPASLLRARSEVRCRSALRRHHSG